MTPELAVVLIAGALVAALGLVAAAVGVAAFVRTLLGRERRRP